jgi:tetratricopeptide (TPR) repeat protein
MKLIKKPSVFAIFISLVQLCSCQVFDKYCFFTSNVTQILYAEAAKNFVIIGYGGSVGDGADCIYRAQGTTRSDSLNGVLVSVNTEIYSYDINRTEIFKAAVNKDILTVNRCDVTEYCGINSNFEGKFNKVIEENQLKSIKLVFVNLLKSHNDNDNVLNLLLGKTMPTMHETTQTDIELLTKVHEDALRLFRNSNSAEAGKVSNDFYVTYGIKPIFLTPELISQFNDLGFFLEQAGEYRNAVAILEAVVNKDQYRAVAYLNWGDALWGLEQQNNACAAYTKYVDLLRMQGKFQKIPKRLFSRCSFDTAR